MNRLDRLSSILIHLQSKRVIKAHEIAERFNISLRTVYRDIRSLEESGVPIVGEAGYGYSLVDGYRLPPVHFSKEEAISFITAQKLIDNFADPITKSNFENALFKIKSVLNTSEKDSFFNLSNTIEVVKNRYLPEVKNQFKEIPQILDAIESKKSLKIKYSKIDELEDYFREIEPIGIYAQSAYWYLIAYCKLRQAYRNFRIDRIQYLEKTSNQISDSHPSLSHFLNTTVNDQALHKVRIKVEKETFRFIGDQHYYHGFVERIDLGKYFELRFLSSSLPGFAHWFLFIGQNAEIIEPQELKDLIIEKIETLKNKLIKSY
jgi:predicted DNA-binding transcriptional regulator YafY